MGRTVEYPTGQAVHRVIRDTRPGSRPPARALGPLLRTVPRPTFGPLSGWRAQVAVRRAAPGALATLGAHGWRLGERFHGRGDTVVLAVRDGAGGQALLKAAGSRQGRAQLDHQVRVLSALHADHRLGSWTRLLPRTLASGEVGGLHFVLESRLPGADLRAVAPGPARERVVDAAVAAITDLQARTAVVAPVDAATLEGWVHRPAAQVRRVTRGGHAAALDRLVAELVGDLAGRAVARSWMHGDYNATNVLVDGSRISGIVDWCEARQDGPVAADTATLLMWEEVLQGAELGPVLLRRLADPGRVGAAVGAVQRRMGGEPLAVRTVLLLGWLKHVAGNLVDSTRYAANPVWMHRNVRTVLQRLY
jgi:aminoglycoside phosphotransferase